jgi:hypothetical protein
MKIITTQFSSDGEGPKWSAYYEGLMNFLGIGSNENEAINNLRKRIKIGLKLIDEPQMILAENTFWVAGDFAFGLTMQEAEENYYRKHGLIE